MKNHLLTTSLQLAVTLLALATTGCMSTGKKSSEARGNYRPTIDPANFSHVVDNPYFPLAPGTTFTFVEKEGRELRENIMKVTYDTKTILGVKCVVVHDTVTIKGVPLEDTYDWYAQDQQGAVWYFGEATKEFKSGGRVITDGSWEAGVKGAQPGIVMQANPQPGEPYRQEYFAGQAEDMAQVVGVGETVTVPFGTFKDCVSTKEWSMLESGSGKKWYAKGVGIVRSETSSGEVSTLISVTKK